MDADGDLAGSGTHNEVKQPQVEGKKQQKTKGLTSHG